jgi:hypothetical protein
MLARIQGERGFERGECAYDEDDVQPDHREEDSIPRHLVAQVAILVALLAGDAEAAVREARATCEAAESLGVVAVRAEFSAVLAQALTLAGRDEEALTYAALAERFGEADGDAIDRLRWRTAKAPLLAGRSEYEEAERVARAAIEAAEATDFLSLHGDAWFALSVSLAPGRTSEAAAAREAAIDLHEQKGNAAAADRARAAGAQ